MNRGTRRRSKEADQPTPASLILDVDETTVLDVLDNLLNKGVVLNGDAVLGVAGVDLVYLRLSSLLCAVDRLQPTGRYRRKPRSRGPRKLKRP